MQKARSVRLVRNGGVKRLNAPGPDVLREQVQRQSTKAIANLAVNGQGY
jgi:hypothetical protein